MHFDEFKIPKITLLLCALILIVYFIFSNNSSFMTQESIYSLGISSKAIFNIITYAFAHVGLLHLISNLIPLIIFGTILENAKQVKEFDTTCIFASSAAISGLIFAATNQTTILVGASAAIAGIIGACSILKPKETLIAALIFPIFFLIIEPGINFNISNSIDNSNEKAENLSEQIHESIQQGNESKVQELNQTLIQVTEFKEQQEIGLQREKTTPSDFLVHIYGLVIGVAYGYLRFKRPNSSTN